MGGILLCLALIEMVYVLSFWVTGSTSNLAPGWSSLMFVILIVGGMLMVLLGFIGVYVGYIFQEVKRRPVYLVKTRGRKERWLNKRYLTLSSYGTENQLAMRNPAGRDRPIFH